jgi:hypothetical protein
MDRKNSIYLYYRVDRVGVSVADTEATDTPCVGVKKIIFIAPSSGTGESTFFPVSITTTIIMMKRKKLIIIPVAAIVFVRSSIYKVYHVPCSEFLVLRS